MKWATPQIVNDAFADFKKLVDENPDDIMIRWMLAVQCRNWDRNAEGAELYRQILERWNPGPVLVHQTYANLLDELGRFEEALVERYKAVKMEPAAWSYDGLGNTLDSLGRYKEASEAHAKAARLAPASLPIWFHWARGLLARENTTNRSKKKRTRPSSNGGPWSFRCSDDGASTAGQRQAAAS